MRSSDIAGKTPEELVPVRMASQLNANYGECVARADKYTYEELLKLPLGEIWWQTTLTPIFDDTGKVVQIIGVAADITSRKHSYLASIQRHAKIKQDMEEFNQTYSTAAHDLRSPLCQLDSLLKLIMLDFQDLGDGKSDLISTSQTVIANSIKYLDEVLHYYRSLGDDEYKPAELDLGHLCSDLAAILDPEALHDIRCEPAVLMTDGPIVQIIVRNLIDNAIKHNDGKLAVVIGVEPVGEGMLEFFVCDSGTGIPASKRSIPLRDKGEGSFGLSGAKRLLVARGGNLWIETIPDFTGALLKFTLPGSVVSVQDQENPATIPESIRAA